MSQNHYDNYIVDKRDNLEGSPFSDAWKRARKSFGRDYPSVDLDLCLLMNGHQGVIAALDAKDKDNDHTKPYNLRWSTCTMFRTFESVAIPCFIVCAKRVPENKGTPLEFQDIDIWWVHDINSAPNPPQYEYKCVKRGLSDLDEYRKWEDDFRNQHSHIAKGKYFINEIMNTLYQVTKKLTELEYKIDNLSMRLHQTNKNGKVF